MNAERKNTRGIARTARTQFESDVRFVRWHFFPTWDRRNAWRIQFVSSQDVYGSVGICERRKKRIRLAAGDVHLIIHECCHAVTSGGHGRKWQNRMEKAAEIADRTGNAGLAKALRDNYRAYADSQGHFRITVDEVYRTLWTYTRNALAEGRTPQYGVVVKSVARTYGLSTAELTEMYRQCRRRYEMAKREHVRDEARQVRMGADS